MWPGFIVHGTIENTDAIVLRWLALHADENGETTVALTTVAKNLQNELGAPTLNAAYRRVKCST